MWLTCRPSAPLDTSVPKALRAMKSHERARIVDPEMGGNVERHRESLRSSAASCSAVPTLSHGPA